MDKDITVRGCVCLFLEKQIPLNFILNFKRSGYVFLVPNLRLILSFMLFKFKRLVPEFWPKVGTS